MPDSLPAQPPTWYLLDGGGPYCAVISAQEAAELFETTPPELRSGSVADGFAYWVDTRNGMNQRIRYVTRAWPIAPDQLPEICKQVSRFVVLPEELRPCT